MAAATISVPADAQVRSFKVLVDGSIFEKPWLLDPGRLNEFQQALDRAKQKFGHALCACRRTPLKLQIRLREGKFHLAVWPEQGHLHDTQCSFFREENTISLTETGARIQLRDDGTQEVHLRYILDRVNHAHQNRELAPSASLRSMLHLLWEQASLTRWHPEWTRDWGRARYELLQASKHIFINTHSLADRLFVPRPYRETARDAINLEWDRFVRQLSTPAGNIIRGALLIAPARKLVAVDERGFSIHLRHLRSPIGLTASTFEFLRNNCTSALRRLESQITQDNSNRRPDWRQLKQPEVIVLAHVEANSRGGIWARTVWLMQVHPQNFIPANNSDEILLIDKLVHEKYQFSRYLTTLPPMQRKRPDWMVRHVYDPQCKAVPRAALEILNNGVSEQYTAQRSLIADLLVPQGIPVWTWTPMGRQFDRKCPALPPKEDLSPSVAREILDHIANHEGLSFTYGGQRNKPN